jgi:hypothetical protein
MNLDNIPDPSSELTFVKPDFTFRGIALKPAGISIRMLWHQAIINDSGDTNSVAFLAWALIFLLSLEKTKARELAFDRKKFRNDLAEWQDQFYGVNSATEEAKALFDRIWESWEGSKVEIQSDGSADPKNA